MTIAATIDGASLRLPLIVVTPGEIRDTRELLRVDRRVILHQGRQLVAIPADRAMDDLPDRRHLQRPRGDRRPVVLKPDGMVLIHGAINRATDGPSANASPASSCASSRRSPFSVLPTVCAYQFPNPSSCILAATSAWSSRARERAAMMFDAITSA